MDDEDLVVDHVAERRGTEDLGEELAHLLLVLGLQLAEEAVKVVGHLGLVVAAVHEDVGRVLQLEGDEGEDDLHAPGAAVHKVAVKDEGVVRRGVAGQAQHVGEVVELAVEVAHDGRLLALGDHHPAQGLLLPEDLEHVERHHVRVLHGQQLADLVVRKRGVEERLVDRLGAAVARARVARGLREAIGVCANLRDDRRVVVQGRLRDLVLDQRGVRRQVRVPLVALVDVGLAIGDVRLARARVLGELGELDGERQLGRLVAHGSLGLQLELARGVVQNLVVDQVNDVPEVPAAHVLAAHGLDRHEGPDARDPRLALRVARVARLLVHLPDHGALAVRARRVPEDAKGAPLELNLGRADHLLRVAGVEGLRVLDLLVLAVPQRRLEGHEPRLAGDGVDRGGRAQAGLRRRDAGESQGRVCRAAHGHHGGDGDGRGKRTDLAPRVAHRGRRGRHLAGRRWSTKGNPLQTGS
mmetsp:Transcript_22565/g.59586  ORF Transcript_22565/g.59586 Transcript_22565/m.59586 type:complete len:469 (+) Transcript_22565:839-2245(+)